MYTTWQFCICVLAVLVFSNVPRGRLQNAVLLIASYALYAYFDKGFVVLLALSTGITFAIARHLSKTRAGQALLWVGVVYNLGVLAIFKYAGFFASSLAAVLRQP